MNNKFNKKSILLLLLSLVMAITLVGCSNNEDTTVDEAIETEDVEVVEEVEESDEIKIKDDLDREIVLEEPASKIVSLAPSHTESLFALGLDEKIVGVTDFCNYPEEAEEKDKIGGFSEPDMEKIVELSPELIFSTGQLDDEQMDLLEETGIKVAVLDPESIEEIYTTIEKMGILTGSEEEAETLISELEEKKEEIVEKVKDAEEVRVFYEIWDDPLMTIGNSAFMNELIELAGGVNITGDLDSEYPEIDAEVLIEGNPEVYLTADDGVKTAEDIKGREGYENIDAIKNDRIYLLDQDIASRAGARIMEALELVAEALHPDLFE